MSTNHLLPLALHHKIIKEVGYLASDHDGMAQQWENKVFVCPLYWAVKEANLACFRIIRNGFEIAGTKICPQVSLDLVVRCMAHIDPPQHLLHRLCPPLHTSGLIKGICWSWAQQMEELKLSGQETSHLFPLPLHTEELGRLPVYGYFEYALGFKSHFQVIVRWARRQRWQKFIRLRSKGGPKRNA